MVQSLIGGDIVNQSREPELQGATVLEVLGGTGGSFVPPVSCKVVDRTLRGDNKHEYWRWLECSSTCLSTDCTGGTKLPPVPPNAGSDVPDIHNHVRTRSRSANSFPEYTWRLTKNRSPMKSFTAFDGTNSGLWCYVNFVLGALHKFSH